MAMFKTGFLIIDIPGTPVELLSLFPTSPLAADDTAQQDMEIEDDDDEDDDEDDEDMRCLGVHNVIAIPHIIDKAGHSSHDHHDIG